MSISKIITIALDEVGYVEKATNSSLYDKKANPGSNNWTKYGEWYGLNGPGAPWCDMFVSWCAEEAGEASAVGRYSYVPYHTKFFKSKGQYFARGEKLPQAGDVIIFREECHIGLVESCDGTYVYTIEGNTSDGNALEPNGGAVCRKAYSVTSSNIQGYGRPSYQEDDKKEEEATAVSTRVLGIDVSEHNGTVNWTAVKQAGVEFAIIRTGYGKSYEDPQFKRNITQAIAQGIHVGVYHFSYALDVAGVKREAEFVLSLLKDYKIDLPVFFDFEYDTIRYAKENGVTLGRQAFLEHTRAFCDAIEAAGYRAGTYYNYSYYKQYYDPGILAPYVQWYAQYNATADITGWDIWQYSSKGTLTGCTGHFDMNEMTRETFNKLTNFKMAGWQKDSNGWWYRYQDGSYPKAALVGIEGAWYYFDDDGYLVQNASWSYNGVLYTADGDGRVTFEEENTVKEEKYYEKLGDLPAHYRTEIDKLVSAGFLRGKSGEGDDMVLDLHEDAVRSLVVLARVAAQNGLI